MDYTLFVYPWLIMWILIYLFEALHDAAICEIEVDLATYTNTPRKKELSKRWHLSDSIMFALFHLGATALSVGFFGFWHGIALLALSLGIRIVLHDTLIELFWKGKIFRPTMNGAWDYWDGLQQYLYEKWHIPIIVFRILVCLILSIPAFLIL